MNSTTDWFDVDQIEDGTYRILEGQGCLPCYVYLIVDGDEAVLIDTGLGIGDLRAVVDEYVRGHLRVVLTHSHWDHIGGANAFENVAINPTERTDDGTVWMDFFSEKSRARPRQFVADWRELGKDFPEGFDPEQYAIEPVTDVGSVSPGDRIDVGDRTLEIVPTPGHSPGQIAVLDTTVGICHGADVIEGDGELYAHLEESDLRAYSETLERLCERRESGAFDCLTIGHGEPIEGDDLHVLGQARDAVDAIRAGGLSSREIDTHWGPTRKYSVGELTILTKSAD